MTLIFALFGAGAIASEVLRMDISELPLIVRIGANVAYVVAYFAIVTRLIPPLR